MEPSLDTPPWLPETALVEVVTSVLGAGFVPISVVVRAERPQRRAVLEVVVEGPRGRELVGVKFRRRRAAAIYRDWCVLAAAGTGFRVPEPLGLVERHGCIVYRWVQAPGLLERLRDNGVRWASAAGEALAQLHGARVDLTRTFSARDALDYLARRIDEAAELGHPRAEALRERLAELEPRVSADEQPQTSGHRDFYPRQVLATEPLTLLDLDEAARCELALDAGNFAAHLVVDGVPGLVEPFLTAALGDDAALRRRERFYRSATFVRLSAVYWIRNTRERALSVPLE